MTRAPHESGFTLTELMVALFVFGLLSAAGVSVLSFTARNQDAVRERVEATGAFQRTRALLKADLSQAAPRRPVGPDGRVEPLPFSGGEGGSLLRLVRRDGERGLDAVEWRLSGDRLERVRREAAGAGPERARVLLTGVRSASVEFLWRGSWSPVMPGDGVQEPLPQAVRLTLDVEGLGAVSQTLLVTGESR